jgi:hypothetical protein
VVALQRLYGAAPVPNSTELLRPGDTLRIRASGAWWLGGDLKPGAPSRVVRDLQVKARLGIYYLPDDHHVQVSANFVPIQLQLNY